MDSQKELEEFLDMLSPSVKERVTNHIFGTAILKNPVFNEDLDIVSYIIDYVQP